MIVDKFNEATEAPALVEKDWDSTIQLECEQGSILN